MPEPAYKLIEITAAGTFGTVCIAQDLHRGKLVALKVLKQAHMHRPRVIARTRDEAVMLSRLDHPHIVEVEALIHIGERPIVVMEWVRGVSLEQLLKDHSKGTPPDVAVELIRQATAALKAAFESPDPSGGGPMNIIHRDVKPSNMLLSVEGELKMVDFGIARGQFQGKQAKTMSMVLGARGYLAPERLDGHDDKCGVDIYGLGICLYELVTGKHIVLSVHATYHAEALEKNLKKLQPEGLGEEARTALSSIIEGMCQYHEHLRPDHTTLLGQIEDYLARFGKPDMRAFGRERVLPMFVDRKLVRPIDHPGYPDLAFLDRTAANVGRPAPPDVNARIAEFLEIEAWHTRRDDLDLILIQNPHWTEAPFLNALPDGVRPWWRFWDREKQADSDEIILLLRYIGQHPITGEVRQRLQPLQEHPDPRVQQAVAGMLAHA